MILSYKVTLGPWVLLASLEKDTPRFQQIPFPTKFHGQIMRKFFAENSSPWPGNSQQRKGAELFRTAQSKCFLRESQHTPGAYPGPPQTAKWKEFLHKSPTCSGTKNGGTEHYETILGMVFSLHKPYIQLIQVSTSILACGRRATMAGDFFCFRPVAMVASKKLTHLSQAS